MKRPTPKPEENNTATDGEIPVLRWSTRRKMAWRCLYTLIVSTALYWFGLPLWFQYWDLPTDWLTIIADSYFWFATTLAAVVVTYMGVTPGAFPFSRRGGAQYPQDDHESSSYSRRRRSRDPDDDIYEEYY